MTQKHGRSSFPVSLSVSLNLLPSFQLTYPLFYLTFLPNINIENRLSSLNKKLYVFCLLSIPPYSLSINVFQETIWIFFPAIFSFPQISKDPTELVLHETASKCSSWPSFKSDPSGRTPLPSRAIVKTTSNLLFFPSLPSSLNKRQRQRLYK